MSPCDHLPDSLTCRCFKMGSQNVVTDSQKRVSREPFCLCSRLKWWCACNSTLPNNNSDPVSKGVRNSLPKSKLYDAAADLIYDTFYDALKSDDGAASFVAATYRSDPLLVITNVFHHFKMLVGVRLLVQESFRNFELRFLVAVLRYSAHKSSSISIIQLERPCCLATIFCLSSNVLFGYH